MSKYISRVGGIQSAREIVDYHKKYFMNFNYFDCKKKMFVKQKDETRAKDFVFMNFLIGEVRKEKEL